MKRTAILTFAMLAAFAAGAQRLLPGDLLFYSDTSGMGAAVKESTGRYTHVAIVETVGDTVWIIDATRRHGVARRPLERQPEGARGCPDAYRLAVPFDTAAVLARARAFVGLPYDDAFMPDNGALYCSELVYECFLEEDVLRQDSCPPKDSLASGREHLFEARPMNWRNAQGELPQYWVEHFGRMGMPVPEGVPGTNPTDLGRSPLLRKL